jgi:hypothetical protein
MIAVVGGGRDSRNIDELKRLIDDESYLSDAIRRIAQVMSDQLIGVRLPGAPSERVRESPKR